MEMWVACFVVWWYGCFVVWLIVKVQDNYTTTSENRLLVVGYCFLVS